MPAGDRTGPMGEGPRTGRAAGFCGGLRQPGFAGAFFGRGAGFGRRRGFGARGGGRGFGFRAAGPAAFRRGYGYYAPSDPLGREEELEALQEESDWLKRSLETIARRISELEAKDA